MVKTYPIDDVLSAVRAWRNTPQGNKATNNPRRFGTSFTVKFLLSLATIADAHNKGKAPLAKSLHKWIRYVPAKGSETAKVVYDTGKYKSRDGWQDGFIDDILAKYDERTISEWNEGLKSNDTLRAEIDAVCAYYDNQGGYFSSIRNYWREEGTITQSDYERLCQNKYASKVLLALRAEPAFTVGSIVDFRSKKECTTDEGGRRRLHKKAPNGLLVLSNTASIISACNGAKRYKVVAVGDTEPFYTEERYLKKKRLNKKKK